MKNKTHKLALFGNPVSHSLSPQIHQNFAKQFDLEINYELIQVNAHDFAKSVKAFFNNGGLGANVTLPHKHLALSLATTLTTQASMAQAVNTLYLDNNKQLCGDNTDGMGFVADMKNKFGFDFAGQSVLILGAGGAAQGIVAAILPQQPQHLVVANRSLQKAQQLCRFDNTLALDLDALKNHQQAFDLIIHASSLGHQGKTLTFESQHIHESTIAYDLSYGFAAEAFMQFCQSKNINKISDGFGMLVEQAALAFARWFGKEPQTAQLKDYRNCVKAESSGT